jgi:RNA polymerase sigma factor for flagellar operon FliA
MDTAQLWSTYKTKPSTSLKKQIMMNYTNLVHYVIHNSRFINLEILDDRDYFQFGVEGLSEAIDRFDPDYGTKFETYAIQRIRGKIIDELRKVQVKPRLATSDKIDEFQYSIVSLNKAIDGEDGYQLYETIPDDTEVQDKTTEKSEMKELLKDAIRNLEERDRLILSLYYYEELSYKEISKILNITVSRISQIHTKILDTLKNKLHYVNG